MNYLFTSESVSEGHPDKVADAISDAVLDLLMAKQDNKLRCACETLVTTDTVIVAGEYKGVLDPVEFDNAVRTTIRRIGYEQPGFDHRTVKITNLMHGQSADIALGTDNFGAGDQGLMFGYATLETPNLMPAALYYSHKIVEQLAQMRKEGIVDILGPDAKSQVTLEYENNIPKRAAKIVCSTQHTEDADPEIVHNIVSNVIFSNLGDLVDDNTELLINPTGRFVIGGPDGDTGVTGRKIIVDTYGGYAPHGGGAFSGKDPTKVDRSAAYMARYLAKNIVYSKRASQAVVQISYAIGRAEPTSLTIRTPDGDDRALYQYILDNVDLTPQGIIKRFDLFRPIYGETTNYGHFGKHWLPWEQCDLF
jgi:S-adenosylmethionine synthetase